MKKIDRKWNLGRLAKSKNKVGIKLSQWVPSKKRKSKSNMETRQIVNQKNQYQSDDSDETLDRANDLDHIFDNLYIGGKKAASDK